MDRSIVFQQRDYDALQGHLFADATREQGALLLAATGTSPTALRLIVREVLALDDGDYLAHEIDRLVIAPHALARAMKRAARANLSLVLVHTHPGAIDRVGFSEVDDEGEGRIFAVVGERLPRAPHASLVFGRNVAAGRIWERACATPIDRVVVVGESLRYVTSDAVGVEPRGVVAGERYDRQVRAFGADGQRTLSSLRVGVVGCGGTGSAVVEQLVRLGVGYALVIDPDIVEESNLTRVYGSTKEDATGRRNKVDLAVRLAAGLGRGVAVVPLVGDVRDEDVARRLIGVDVIFGCTDSHWSRLVLNRLSTQYLIPLIDLGTRIDARGGTLRGVVGRVSTIRPGDPCLFCAGVINGKVIAAESLPDDERRKQMDEGYIQGVEEHAPSVISLNTVVAGAAVTECLRMATGWRADGNVRGHQSVYNALTGTMRAVSFDADPACWCRDVVGCGDAMALPCRPSPRRGVESSGRDSAAVFLS